MENLISKIVENVSIHLQEAYEDDLSRYNQKIDRTNRQAANLVDYGHKEPQHYLESSTETIRIGRFAFEMKAVHARDDRYISHNATIFFGGKPFKKSISDDKPFEPFSSKRVLETFLGKHESGLNLFYQGYRPNNLSDAEVIEFFKALMANLEEYTSEINSICEQLLNEVLTARKAYFNREASVRKAYDNRASKMETYKQDLEKSFLNDNSIEPGEVVTINRKVWTVDSVDESANTVKMTSENGATRQFDLDTISELYARQRVSNDVHSVSDLSDVIMDRAYKRHK